MAQALAKIERGHRQDTDDVQQMLSRGLVTVADVRTTLEAIAGRLYGYPAVDPSAFRSAVDAVTPPPA